LKHTLFNHLKGRVGHKQDIEMVLFGKGN